MPYDEYPQFAGYGTKAMICIIEDARLSRTDQEIALGRLVEHRDYADIAAQLHRDRSGVSKRLRHIIIPHLMDYIARHDRA